MISTVCVRVSQRARVERTGQHRPLHVRTSLLLLPCCSFPHCGASSDRVLLRCGQRVCGWALQIDSRLQRCARCPFLDRKAAAVLIIVLIIIPLLRLHAVCLPCNANATSATSARSIKECIWYFLTGLAFSCVYLDVRVRCASNDASLAIPALHCASFIHARPAVSLCRFLRDRAVCSLVLRFSAHSVAGWFGSPGVSCTRCAANSYQPAQNQTACIPCQVRVYLSMHCCTPLLAVSVVDSVSSCIPSVSIRAGSARVRAMPV